MRIAKCRKLFSDGEYMNFNSWCKWGLKAPLAHFAFHCLEKLEKKSAKGFQSCSVCKLITIYYWKVPKMRESQVSSFEQQICWPKSYRGSIWNIFKNNSNTFYLKKKTQCKYKLKPMHALS